MSLNSFLDRALLALTRCRSALCFLFTATVSTLAFAQATPPAPLVFDDGDFTRADDGFSVRWVQFDPASQVLTHEYRVTLDGPGGEVLRDWTAAGGAMELTVQGLPAREGQPYFFHVRGVLAAGVTEAGSSDGIILDRQAPQLDAFDDGGDWSRAASALSASWAASDPEGAGVTAYRYAIGTRPDLEDVVSWTDVGARTSITATGLDLEDGATYYWRLEVRDRVGNVLAAAADGVTVDRAAPAVTVTDQ
ncbi:MAG: hypothetical protein AAFX85_16600, partial [Pseudomonadota bacterium]